MKKVSPMIHVPDVRATVDWYEQIGFEVRSTYGDGTATGLSFAIIKFGASEVMFSADGETSDKHRREVELYENLKDRVDIFETPHDTFYGMREFTIRDLNRFWITFGQPIADANGNN